MAERIALLLALVAFIIAALRWFRMVWTVRALRKASNDSLPPGYMKAGYTAVAAMWLFIAVMVYTIFLHPAH